MTYDHVELKIFVNGRPTEARFYGIRGTVFPVVYGKYQPSVRIFGCIFSRANFDYLTVWKKL